MLIPANVLVIGSGGREHAICWKLAQSEKVKTVFVAPGNAGMAVETKVRVVADLDVNNHRLITDWCKVNNVNLVVVGPEDHLARGIKDSLSEKKIHCFGPSKRASQIESDKEWAKNFMDKHAVPTARWGSFTSSTEAKAYINSATFPALVVKASGLAAGKGVVVASTREEACQAVDSILTDRKFGNAGSTVVIEELLEGEEVSVLAFTDGRTVELMLPSQDHKRHLDGDRGANTGGMGAYCPCPLLSGEQLEAVQRNIMQRTIDGMRADDSVFQGVLYAGLMLTKNGPRVLEFNCRFGDPETQVILPLLESDLYDVMMACVEGRLERTKCLWKEDVSAVGVIMASKGYPESSSKGNVITGLDIVGKLDRHLVFHSGTATREGCVVTNGGRVLISVSLHADLALASTAATQACDRILFEGAQYRRDIAHKGIARVILEKGQLTYRAAGVDISAGDSLVDRIKLAAGLTGRTGVLGSIGGFGGVFDPRAAGYKDPLLVSGTDGVGTKLKIAQACSLHSTIGIDLVAMCVNDILAHGAEPLFFLDYFACGKLDVGVAGEVVAGVAEGCKQAGCALIGGETAEMPGLYSGGDYDLAGFAVGAVERGELLPLKDSISPGDVLIGLPSSGVHSNGFSLVRKVMRRCGAQYGDKAAFGSGTYGEELLTPTRIYVKGVLPALRGGHTKAFAHITGGGLTENIPRVLPPSLSVELDAALWDIPPVFPWLAAVGGVNETEMLKTFNCGVGAILVVAPELKMEVLQLVAGERPVVIGSVRKFGQGEQRVKVKNFVASMETAMRPFVAQMVSSLTPHKRRVAVLISGSGTNLQSLIDATLDPDGSTGAEIILVISNKANVEGLKRAERANIPTKVISHTDYKTRLEFDMAVHGELTSRGAELVCLAGFMRVLTGDFVRLWRGRLVNIHPALLPLFKGTHANRQALAAGVRVTGCTAHFVEEDVDAGAILAQEAVPIELGDTEATLQERVKLAEHRVFPRALALVASGKASLDSEGKLVWRQ